MQVQVDSNHIEGSAELQEWVGSTVGDELEHYSDLLTRIEIHVGDVNAQKAGAQDKRCQIEARPKGHTPLCFPTRRTVWIWLFPALRAK